MARPKSDPEVMRQRILDAAEQLIVEHGAKAVTLRQIAKKVGVSHPAVLYYFDGLPALIEALQQRTARALRTTLLSQLSDVGAPGVRTSVAGDGRACAAAKRRSAGVVDRRGADALS